MSLTSKVNPYKFGFGPFAPEIYRLPYPYIYRRPSGISEKDYIQGLIAHLHEFFKTNVAPDSVAAIILELVTGEGGIIVMPPDYLQELSNICKEHKILLIIDEVQTGFARTGLMFATEHYSVTPDIMTMAKSMSSGMPIAAVTGRAEIMESVHVAGLGGTFGGNPLSCAASLATIEEINSKKLRERSREIGKRVSERIVSLKKTLPSIGDVRGLGAMIGIELVNPNSASGKDPNPELTNKAMKLCYERGLLILSAGVYSNVIRTLMPLCITDEQLEEGLAVLEEVLMESTRS